MEELLRYDCPVLVTARFAMQDTEVAGQAIPRGSSVLFMLGAANRDPAVFPDPDRLDIARSAKHHVAFSHGAHYCLGASLARLELLCAPLRPSVASIGIPLPHYRAVVEAIFPR